ncbi:MAG: glycoside hydrolase family 92 protein [Clostridiales bacterium]|jgi:putative alpha-1,2-mannosidase|nr:glycoside hydrolase family 92 protein [Clostridiales bacterium]
MKNYSACVDVFYGSGDTVTPPASDPLSLSWKPIKAVCGNTSPSATLPFGSVSCTPYSGGYSSGYGNNKINWGEKPEKLFAGSKLIGFSHLNHSGIGALGLYYNYAVTAPFRGGLKNAFLLKDIGGENGSPGFYSAEFTDEKIKASVTAGRHTAVHKYESDKGFRLAVNFANDGLYRDAPRVFSHAENGSVFISDDGTVCAEAVFQGVKIHFCVRVTGADKTALWLGGGETGDRELTGVEKGADFGCVFDIKEKSTELRLSLSLLSHAQALAFLDGEKDSFAQILKSAKGEWDKRLGAVDITASEKDTRLFYSNLYHTIIKPADFSGQNYLFESESFVTDFCTLWDMYKTQLPLVFTLYKDMSARITDTLIGYGKKFGKLFHNLVLSSNMSIEAKQAAVLSCYVLADAWYRGHIKDYGTLSKAMRGDIESCKTFLETSEMPKTTMLLDIAEACGSLAEIAGSAGDTKTAAEFGALQGNWIKAFDEKTGLLRENYDYYEGNHWSYSFRPMRDYKERIAIAGGREKYLGLLDRFFGFTEPENTVGRFQGFNNETDMETPYAYIDAGEPDKTAQIIRAGLDCYSLGRNGLPGNNDSGGLSSCFIWNFLGLFPVSGQNKIYLSRPSAERAVIHLSNGNKLEILKKGNGGKSPAIFFNGERIGNTLTVSELMRGGLLEFT